MSHPRPRRAAPLGLVRTGDWIALDGAGRRLDVDTTAAELELRRPAKEMTGAFAAPARGWERRYVDHVTQADTGADLDFLVGSSGHEVSRESH